MVYHFPFRVDSLAVLTNNREVPSYFTVSVVVIAREPVSYTLSSTTKASSEGCEFTN